MKVDLQTLYELRSWLILYCVVFPSPVLPYTSCCRFYLKLKCDRLSPSWEPEILMAVKGRSLSARMGKFIMKIKSIVSGPAVCSSILVPVPPLHPTMDSHDCQDTAPFVPPAPYWLWSGNGERILELRKISKTIAAASLVYVCLPKNKKPGNEYSSIHSPRLYYFGVCLLFTNAHILKRTSGCLPIIFLCLLRPGQLSPAQSPVLSVAQSASKQRKPGRRGTLRGATTGTTRGNRVVQGGVVYHFFWLYTTPPCLSDLAESAWGC